MGKIQELSERLANQIAAGEVVERPASVVKELVENAVDAGSTQIDIFIEEAGLRKIQVIDNGEGIAEEDVVTAFKRHATSKIHNRDDLFRIRTLGFRGEALPSIASVSILTIETAVKDAPQGSFLRLKGGAVEEHTPANLRQGTKITVENLFYNTPARLKYVKTLQTELANIGDIVNRIALSHPEVAFRLVHEGNKMLTTTGSGDLKQTVAGIYGVETAKKMLAINSEDLDFKLTGYVSLPEVTRASRNYLSTIINGRYIRNFALNKAIVAGYGSKLMVGRFPIAVLEITMDPLLVDVNVHPTKQEVRLSKEEELTALISKSINEALREENLIPNAADNLRFKKKVATDPVEQTKLDLGTSPTTSSGLTFNRETGKFQVTSPGYQQTVDNFVENPVEEGGKLPEIPEQRESSLPFAEHSVEDPALFDSLEDTLPNKPLRDPFAATAPVTDSVKETDQLASESLLSDDSQNLLETHAEEAQERLHPEVHAGQQNYTKYVDRLLEETPAKQRFPQLEYFGQMHGTYLFAQSDEGLYIVDQHAAQERIKYEYYREKIGEVTNDLQELLVPIVLDYPNNDAIKLKEQNEKLQEVGIHLEDFGANSFIVRAHPTWYPAGEEESIIREMIDMLLETGSVSVKKFREATAIMMSCKRSIKANHYLNEAQARILLADLAKCENPFNCPHGRPVLIHFTNSDMERMFKRIQDPHRTRSGME
jgi:DNA mismatch repair protein MutL